MSDNSLLKVKQYLNLKLELVEVHSFTQT